jgi:exopolyphosphatase/guanosine-5'-triphosphate,3'-diphosphate pyrophosphatase
VRLFAERCHYEQPHAEHVQTLALQLFDSLGRRLGCEPADRAILADAALLHDVGYHIGHVRHHKHSFHLIAHAELLGVSPEEQIMIAHVARYHRGAEPKGRHREYSQLDTRSRRRIKRLAAILRLADGLDRGHAGAVRQVKVRWLSRAVRIMLLPHSKATSLRLEVWGATRKAAVLEKLTKRKVELVARDGSVYREQPQEAAG